jgi:hypothetical protein
MSLREIKITTDDAAIPGDVSTFLREANKRIEEFQTHCRVPGFVPCDFERTYCFLRAVAAAAVARGSLFCEWGSGFGVVTCLAAFLDFDAVGIEIEGELVNEAQQLADDFGLPVEFLHGSYLPPGCGVGDQGAPDFSWLHAEENELEFDPDDFDVIFAYPWPDEEDLAARLFDRYASKGAVLASYHGGDEFRLRRKVGKK